MAIREPSYFYNIKVPPLAACAASGENTGSAPRPRRAPEGLGSCGGCRRHLPLLPLYQSLWRYRHYRRDHFSEKQFKHHAHKFYRIRQQIGSGFRLRSSNNTSCTLGLRTLPNVCGALLPPRIPHKRQLLPYTLPPFPPT